MSIDDMFKKEEKKLRKLFDTKLLSELLLLNYQYSNNEYLGTTAEDVYNSLSKKIKYTKKEYLDNYVFNAIVNHANYYYKSKKKNHINEDKIIEEIILNDYLKNKKKSRFNILKNYLSNSNPKSKFKNRYQVENAIRKINDEMEDAQKEFSKLFQNNEKDYN